MLMRKEFLISFGIPQNAKKAGCQFTFGTDSHSVKSLELVRVGDLVAEHLGLTKADIAEYLQDGVEE